MPSFMDECTYLSHRLQTPCKGDKTEDGVYIQAELCCRHTRAGQNRDESINTRHFVQNLGQNISSWPVYKA